MGEDGNHYRKIFIFKMEELGYKKTDFYKFKYIGSSKKGIISDCWRHLECKVPKQQDFCLCTKEIRENCYIYNQETGEILSIGNHCIKRFIGENPTGNRCDKCGDRHRNTKNNYCNKCRVTIEQEKKQKILTLLNERQKYYKIKCRDCFKPCEPYVRCFDCNKQYKKKCDDYNNNRTKYYIH